MAVGSRVSAATMARTLPSVSSGWSPVTKRQPARCPSAARPARTVSLLRGPSARTQRTPSRSQRASTASQRVTTTASSRSPGSAASVRSSTAVPASGATSFSPGAPPKRAPSPDAMTTQPRRATPPKPEKHVS